MGFMEAVLDLTRVALDEAIDANPKEAILKYFKFSHLPEHLQTQSAEFAKLAVFIVARAEPSAERAVALRKLLESKDAAVRSVL